MINKLDLPTLGNNPPPIYDKEIISWWNDSPGCKVSKVSSTRTGVYAKN